MTPPAGDGMTLPGRILVVDDTAFNRQLLGRLLRGIGHEPVEAEDNTSMWSPGRLGFLLPSMVATLVASASTQASARTLAACGVGPRAEMLIRTVSNGWDTVMSAASASRVS